MARSYIKYYRWNYWRNDFVCNFIGNYVCVLDTSLYSGLNPIIISSIKSSTKTSTSSHCFVFLIFYIMSVISLVYIDGMFMSVYTDNFSEEKILLVNITAKDWQKKPSAIPFVFVQFYRYFNSSSTNLPTESNRRWIVISPTE